METKECKDCKREMPLDYYHYSDKPKGILKSYCKDCSYKRARNHIEQDPLAYQYYMKRYYQENPDKYPGNYKTKKTPPVAGVYVVECLLTDDKYIGCSSNLRNRKYKHSRNVGVGKQKPLSKLIKELGWEAFNFDVLELCDKEMIFVRETHWIQELQPNLNKNKTK
jgi:predicted GIY-YIG superfamily endonuclease